MTVQRLYKYLSIQTPNDWNHRKQLLVDRELYFSDPANFNDPLDCNLATADHLKGMLYTVRVFCMSGQDRDDSLMFAHYADSHRGFRLTFEIDTDRILDEIGVLGRGEYVSYSQVMPDFDRSNIHRSLLIKADSWSYEAEYRIFAVNSETLKYDKDALIEVAFGHRMNPDFEPVIRNWVKKGGHEKVRYLRAVPSNELIKFDYMGT